MPNAIIVPLLYNYIFMPGDLSENGYSEDLGGYYRSSPFSYATLITSARTLAVDAYSTVHSSYPQFSQINVRVDGADYDVVEMTADGLNRGYVILPEGEKTVELIAALQSQPSDIVLGSFLVGVSASAPLIVIAPASNNRLLVYGDSISVGGNADVPSREGWVPLLRALRGNVMIEGWGWRSLYDDANSPELRSALVSRLASYAPSELWLAVGTNDYGLNKWSAASFGTAYAALLDDLHTALPDAWIYCQAPIDRTTETANGSGSTLGDYRTQISNAAAARPSYCTYVDGSAWTIPLADGVHPTTAGHATYANEVAAALGL